MVISSTSPNYVRGRGFFLQSVTMLTRFLAIIAGPLLSVVLVAQSSPPQGSAIDKDIFGNSRLHRIQLSMSEAEWKVLQTSNGVMGIAGGAPAGDAGQDYKQADGRLVHVGSGFRGYFPWVHTDMRV